MTTTRIAILAFASLLIQAGVTNANHIDFIVDGQFFLNTEHVTGFVSSVQTGDPGNILGAEREVSIDVVAGQGFVSAGTLGAAMGAGPVGPDMASTLLFSNSVGAVGQLDLTYDGVGSAGLGGLDFDTAYDAIAVNIAAVQGSGDLTVMASDGTNSGSVTLPVTTPGILTFPFADAGFAGVNFAAVDSVKVTLLTVEPASDFEIAAITREVIPEPGSGMLALLAAAPIAMLRRRRK